MSSLEYFFDPPDKCSWAQAPPSYLELTAVNVGCEI